MVKASKTVTINRPREHVYGFWRRLDNLPSFMFHLQSVEGVNKADNCEKVVLST